VSLLPIGKVYGANVAGHGAGGQPAPAVPAHKYRSAKFVPLGHSDHAHPDLLVCLHNRVRTKLVAVVVDFSCASFDDNEYGR
jgi:hypothetical protein